MKNSLNKHLGLRPSDGFEVPGSRMPGEPLIEVASVDIDYKCFKKNPAEKAQLKAAKAICKAEEMRK